MSRFLDEWSSFAARNMGVDHRPSPQEVVGNNERIREMRATGDSFSEAPLCC